MPTYEYRCPEGHDFEKFFRTISSAASTLPCPKCGAEAERQLSGGAGLMFKGSGFYLTDYGKNAHAPKPPAKSEGKAEAAKPSESKGSEKPTSSEGGSSSAKPAAKKSAE
jgi:putative FmdB family regulatory protein